jgi:hypothetical protein
MKGLKSTRQHHLGKPSLDKNLFLFGKSPKGLVLPPPPVFLESCEDFFLNLILDKLKFLKLDFSHPPQYFLENLQTKGIKVPQNVWNLVNPPALEKV